MAHHGAECEECKWFVPARHASGRINRRFYGECTYVVVWPKVPVGYRWQPPTADKVWCDTNAEDCPCFEENAK